MIFRRLRTGTAWGWPKSTGGAGFRPSWTSDLDGLRLDGKFKFGCFGSVLNSRHCCSLMVGAIRPTILLATLRVTIVAERERNGRNGEFHSSEADPERIVSVQDFSTETLRSVIAHLEASTEFEHLVYREAELDAIWTITGFFLVNEPRSSERETVKLLHAGVHRAHDLVAASQPDAAAAVLRAFL